MHPVVNTKNPAETTSGSDTFTSSSKPATTGATTPARRERAEAMPVAVPRVAVGKASGV